MARPNWFKVRRAFVTRPEQTVAELAKEFKTSRQAVNEHARRGKWRDERAAHWYKIDQEAHRIGIINGVKLMHKCAQMEQLIRDMTRGLSTNHEYVKRARTLLT